MYLQSNQNLPTVADLWLFSLFIYQLPMADGG